MKRREFLKTLVGGACAIALAQWQSSLALAGQARALLIGKADSMSSRVAINRFGQEGGAAKAVQSALDLIGGIDRVVKAGDVVVIKPNLGNAEAGRWQGRVTNTKVMEGVIKAVVDCGGKPIVAEGTCDGQFGGTTGFAEKTGLLKVCRRYKAKFVDLNDDDVVRVKVPRPLIWSEFHMARQVVECDKFISVPVMKVHRATGVTLGMKNLVGVTSRKYYGYNNLIRSKLHAWERKLWSQRYGSDMSGENEIVSWLPLGATIADLASARKIDLVVVDGTFGEERNSPSGDLVDIKERSGSYMILAGTDTVAVDAVGAHIMRQAPERLAQLRLAEAKGLGSREIDRIKIVGERLEDVAVPMRGYIMWSAW